VRDCNNTVLDLLTIHVHFTDRLDLCEESSSNLLRSHDDLLAKVLGLYRINAGETTCEI
jgi:hypothetical protein